MNVKVKVGRQIIPTADKRNKRLNLAVSKNEISMLNKLSKSQKQSRTTVLITALKEYNRKISEGELFHE